MHENVGLFPPAPKAYLVQISVQEGTTANKPHTAYHDEPLGQPGPGEEVNDAQPLWQAQVPEGGRLQGDGVGGGRPHRRLPLVALRAADRLRWGQTGFCWQPLVEVSELQREEQMWERHSKDTP